MAKERSERLTAKELDQVNELLNEAAALSREGETPVQTLRRIQSTGRAVLVSEERLYRELVGR